MKKIYIFIAVLIIIIILGLFIYRRSNKLICTYNENYEDIKIVNEIVFNFEDNTYEQVDKMIFQDNDSAKDYLKDVSEYIEEYNLQLVDNIIISKIEDTIKLDATKKEIKKQYESYDYMCR